jgi:2-desacetyl-2-hydroxyethyl bacteriochlorophyllide A dehydrogenase
MRALFYNLENKKFRIKEIGKPKAKRNSVLIEVKYSALCGTDIHAIEDKILREKIYNKKEIILGHAWSGLVSGVGPGEKKFNTGDRVFGNDFIPCGKCYVCTSKKENLCDNRFIPGIEAIGTHSGFAVFPSTFVHKLPKRISLRDGSVITDVYGVVYHAIKRAGIVRGSRVAIYGVGPIGLALGILLREVFKIKQIFVCDLSIYRRRLAVKLFGAKILKNKKSDNFRNIFDVVFEASGSKEAFDSGIRVVKRGGSLVIVGIHRYPLEIPALKILSREISIIGTFAYNLEDLRKVLSFANGLDFGKIITHEFSLEDAGAAYALFKSKKSGSVILKI